MPSCCRHHESTRSSMTLHISFRKTSLRQAGNLSCHEQSAMPDSKIKQRVRQTMTDVAMNCLDPELTQRITNGVLM